MQMLVDTALAKGWSVGWEGDVTNRGFSSFSGFAALDNSSHNYDEERLQNYKTEATERDHMLHLVGIGKDENKQKWYHMKNSWGSWANSNGYLFMSEEYFKLNTVIMMVNKAALPQSLRKKLKLE
jgi:bleomycin hydrolase